MQLRGAWVLWIALALQLIPYVGVVEGELRRTSEERVLASYLLIAGWLVLNAKHARGAVRGALLVLAVGWALNVAIIAANHGSMPVERDALDDLGRTPLTAGAIERGGLYKHRVARASTRLRMLDDRVPIAALAAVISIGDVLLLAGITAIAAAAMRPDG